MNNAFAQVVMSEDESREAQKIALAKRKGYRYIPIKYIGHLPLMAIRIQGARAIEVVEDENTDGTKTYRPVEGSGLLAFKEDAAGEIVGEIWDDEDGYNRHWLRSIMDAERPEIEVTDPKIAAEIKDIELVPEPDEMGETVRKRFKDGFKVELSDDERDLKEFERLKKRLTDKGVLVEEKPPEEAEPVPEPVAQPETRERGRPPTRRVLEHGKH